MKITRINKIQEMLIKENSLSINHLCDTFGVSKNTIRRDIVELQKRGIIKKVYGGIMLKEKPLDAPEPFNLRETKNYQLKQKVAHIATNFVNDNDVIFIDSGTTTMHMLPYLAPKHNLTIITTSLHVINATISQAATKEFNLIATGGTLYYPSMAFVGPSVLKCLDNYNISKMFLSSTGISLENGATNASVVENEVKRKLVTLPSEKYLLVDSSKIDVSGLMTYSTLDKFDYVVMDKEPPSQYMDYFKKNNIKLLTDIPD